MTMRKIITLICFFVFAISVAIPTFAQGNSQQKANEINAAGQQSIQSNSASEARNIGDAVWNGSKNGNASSSMNAGKTIDIISNNEDTVPQDKPSTFDKPKTEDATPWKGLLIALCSTFMSGIALMLATFIAAESVRNADLSEKAWGFANTAITVMLLASVAIFIAAIVMATIIILKYKQYLMGSIWAAASVLLLGFLIDTLRRAFFGKGLSTAVSAVGISLSLLGIGGGAFLMAKPDVVSSKPKK